MKILQTANNTPKIAFLLLLSFATQISFLLVLPKSYRAIEASDYFTFYAPVAQNLAEGRGLLVNGELPTRYPPGFPAFLAPQFYFADHLHIARTTAMKVCNVCVGALTCLIVFWLAVPIFGEKTGLVAAILWATYPFNLWLVKQPDSEIPFMAVFLLALWSYLLGVRRAQWVWFVLAGVLLGMAALIRPIALFIPILLAGMLVFYRPWRPSRRFLLGAFLLGFFMVTILPWEVALRQYTGDFAPLSTGGPISIEDGLIFPTKAGNTRGHAWVPQAAEQLAYRIRQNEPALQTTGGIAVVLSSEWKREPLPVVEIGLLKMARSWYGDDSMRHEGLILIIQCFYFVLAIPGIWLAWRSFPARRFELCALFGMILYFWGMTILVLSILRYMVPIMPIMLMFAAVSLSRINIVFGATKNLDTSIHAHDVH